MCNVLYKIDTYTKRAQPRGRWLVAQAVVVMQGVVQRCGVLLVARVVRRGRGRGRGRELARQRRSLVLVARTVRRLQVAEQARGAGRPSFAPPPRAARRACARRARLRARGRSREARRRPAGPAGAPHAHGHLQVATLDVTGESNTATQ